MINSNSIPDLEHINTTVFQVIGIVIKNVVPEPESQEYCAHEFELNTQKVKFRTAKITPTKTGLFVSIWKRNHNGITAPHDFTDALDLLIIAVKELDKFGIFIFNKTVLSKKKILTTNDCIGKRGIRVYPTWSKPINKQAIKTQNWQTEFF